MAPSIDLTPVPGDGRLLDMTTTRTDDNGHQHQRRCWERVEGALMDELLANDIDETIEYLNDGTMNYRIPAWHVTQQELVATWLSDGTVSCDCDEE